MTLIPDLPAPRPITAIPDYVNSDVKLRDAAQKMEATFLAEMLKSAGVGKPRDGFGGGEGEDHFSSFLRDAQAEEMAKSGGVGLAEALFEAMKVRGLV